MSYSDFDGVNFKERLNVAARIHMFLSLRFVLARVHNFVGVNSRFSNIFSPSNLIKPRLNGKSHFEMTVSDSPRLISGLKDCTVLS